MTSQYTNNTTMRSRTASKLKSKSRSLDRASAYNSADRGTSVMERIEQCIENSNDDVTNSDEKKTEIKVSRFTVYDGAEEDQDLTSSTDVLVLDESVDDIGDYVSNENDEDEANDDVYADCRNLKEENTVLKRLSFI
eukprot:Pgem_evm2s500